MKLTEFEITTISEALFARMEQLRKLSDLLTTTSAKKAVFDELDKIRQLINKLNN